MSTPFLLFHDICHYHPDINAIVTSKETLTYAQLYQKVLGIAARLSQSDSSRIVICMGSESDAYAAMFACLMLSYQYCPLDINSSEYKKQQVIDVYQPDLILCNTDIFSDYGIPVATTNTNEWGKNEAEKHVARAVNPNTIAYTIFTSGSTGKPKGVQITVAALANYLKWVKLDFPLKTGLRWSQFPNIAFDLSVLDIYGALCHGATLYPLSTQFERLFPARFIERSQLEIWNSTPSVLDVILQDTKTTHKQLESLKLVTVCGEALQETTLDTLFTICPDIKVQNTYGPTEATVSCSKILLTKDNYKRHCFGSAAIGRPTTGMGFKLDPIQNTSDLYELIVYGIQVSTGYLHRPDLNAEKFGEMDVDGLPQRYYRTGDLVTKKGEDVYFHSRKDLVVKVRGKLIDIAAVERYYQTLLDTPVFIGSSTKVSIVFVPTGKKGAFSATLNQAKKILESQEVPNYCVEMDHFPMTENGKINRKELNRLANEKLP